MTSSSIAETMRLAVDPRPLFVPTGIEVAAGETYRLTASGKWRDGLCTTGPEGWGGWLLRLGNRLPSAAIFCLCGCIGKDERQAFAIGAGLQWTVPAEVAGLADRQLYLFANDWRAFYGNNHELPSEKGGPLTVEICRIASEPHGFQPGATTNAPTNTRHSVFIAYRRDDGGHAGRLHDHLTSVLSDDEVFIDRQDLTPGQQFREELDAAIRGARVCVVVIGQHWLSDRNRQRLRDAKDVARNEIRVALECRAADNRFGVIPVVAGGADTPKESDLPAELAGFAALHRLPLGDANTYRNDVNALLDQIHDYCPGLRARRQNAWISDGLHCPDQSWARFGQDIAVRASGRQPIRRLAALAALDTWWNGWTEHRRAFVMLGEEGDGKSWATAEWLAEKLATGEFDVPVVYAPALRLDSPTVLDVLAACLEQSLRAPARGWPEYLRELADQSPSGSLRFLLVVDALNERTHLDWRRLFDDVRAAPWRHHVALLALCRSPYWLGLRVPDDGNAVTWTLPPFDDPELDQALVQRGSRRSCFDADVLHLMARPRYFDLAFRLQGQIEKGGLTLERLIYEDWRDMTARKQGQACSENDFQALISGLARSYATRSFANADFATTADGTVDHIVALRKEFESARILERRGERLAIEKRYLPLGLGMVLAAEVEECGVEDSAALDEVIAKRMGAYREADLQVRICAMAFFHALNTRDYPEIGCLALLRAWIAGRNLDEADLASIAAYLPLRPGTYLRLAEHIWGEANNRDAQDAFMIGFLRHRALPAVRRELVPAFTRWLGFIHPSGYRAYYEQDADKLAEHRLALEQRLGQPATPGVVPLLGVALEVVPDLGRLRLAQVALAVISHDRARGYADAILTGIVASAVMEGSHAEFAWVVRTSCAETRRMLLTAAKTLLAEDKPIAYLAARTLLSCLGSAEARRLRETIPEQFQFLHPIALMHAENPCDSHGWRWQANNWQDCLQRTRGGADFIARQLEELALDPDVACPASLPERLATAGEDLNLGQVARFMANTTEQHALDNMEPALCAFAANRQQALMRALARDMATRDGLARRQLAFHLIEHIPFLSTAERDVLLAAWRSTLTLDDEDNRFAETALFPAVVFDLSAEEQLQRVLERGDRTGYFTQHAPAFRPLTPEQMPQILAALDSVALEPLQRLYNLLWYLAWSLRHPEPGLAQRLLRRFGEFDAAARRMCLEIIVQSGDAAAARDVIAAGWQVDGGRDRFLEDAWGSILLAESGIDQPFDALARRISPEWLGHAVRMRGFRNEEVAAYAQVLDAVWRRICTRTPAPEIKTVSPYVALRIEAALERLGEKVAIEDPDSACIRFANYTWGGSAGAGSLEALRRSYDQDGIVEQHNSLAHQVADLAERERQQGNPWFDCSFRDGCLPEVLALAETPWRSWIDPVLRDDRRAWQLLSLCRGFYEKLCAALLVREPETGYALFQAIRARPTIRINDARLGLPVLLMDAFAAPASPQVETILREHIDSVTSDLDLCESALLCQHGGRTEWMRQLADDWLASDNDYDRARGIALMGFSIDGEDETALQEWIASHNDCWLRDHAENSLKNHRRNAWARRWFSRFLERTDRTEAWAAFRLFLRCVDRRFWLWIDDTDLASASTWKRDAVRMNRGAIESACRENEKGRKDKFLDHRIKDGELWPWMARYQ